MTSSAGPRLLASNPTAPLLAAYGAVAFCGAALVFLVEPLMAKLLLPSLGGSPTVWNISLAFFQAALLIGYAYAHGLQRLKSLPAQTVIHVGVLALGALMLPLRVTTILGPPSADAPTSWLLGALSLSIGLPFAALSATAPLIQSWYARALGRTENPYVLYAASNLGSLLALLSYPVIVEPLLRLGAQTMAWSVGYIVFIASMGLAGLGAWGPSRGRTTPTASVAAGSDDATSKRPLERWRRRAVWVMLAAAPSSLMVGVTSYITTDLGSAPLLWVAPLALYLVTFIMAFQANPAISPATALLLHGFALVAAVTTWGMPVTLFWVQAAIQLLAFFATALICHQGLAARRPPAEKLTEFYLLVSLGGVLGSAFNAFLAPVIFQTVLEYPLVLVAACLARPRRVGRPTRFEILEFAIGLLGVGAAVAIGPSRDPVVMKFCLGASVVCAFRLRERVPALIVLCVALLVGGQALAPERNTIRSARGFFGVVRIIRRTVPGLGEARLMAHGVTLHGAQFLDPRYSCMPTLYYAHSTPIGQVFDIVEARRPRARLGAVGMGVGTIATYVRPGDRMRFFEIDPLVVRLATDPANFSFIRGCSRGEVDWVVGDARLTLAREPDSSFDVLLLDAFSSDSIPAHLLTVEAIRGYLRRIRPDGVVVLHLSNNHLELTSSVAAAARAAGGVALRQFHRPPPGRPDLVESPEDAVIIARTPSALAPFAAAGRWRSAETGGVAPWTDDYTDLVGALIRGVGHINAESRRAAREPDAAGELRAPRS